MKENLKNKKGITLIALVITIIVLLILAIVTIRIMTNENIIGHANNAVTAYNEAQNNETAQLTWVEELMKNRGSQGGSSTSTKTSGLWDLTESEKAEIKAKGGHPASEVYYIVIEETETSAKDVVIIADNNGEDIVGVMIMTGIRNGDEMQANSYLILREEKYGLEKNKWYISNTFVMDPANFENNAILYNGGAPISKGDFQTFYCETYLDRVIASF